MSSLKRKRSLCNNQVKENENSDVPDSVNMVMNLEELRDIIVTQVITYKNIFNGNHEKDIRSLRLVSKDWLSSVSKPLYKYGIPLIQFDFDANQKATLIRKFVRENLPALASGSWPRPFNLNDITPENIATAKHNAKTLDEFVKNFRSDFSANNRNAPTYSLKLDSTFLEAGNYPALQNCLVHCGKGLVQLKIELSRNSHIPKTLPKFALPTLQKLWFNSATLGMSASSSNRHSETECIENAANLLKHLLEASVSLEELSLLNTVGLNVLGFDNYLLPSTLSTLWITTFGLKDVEILSRNLLPNISTLYLLIRNAPDLGDVLFNMLNNWRKTLKSLSLDLNCDYYTQSIQVRYPVMEKLTRLVFNGRHCDLNHSNNGVETCLPKLKTLDLSVGESGFQMWCANSVFRLVENLNITLRNRNLPLEHIAINLQNIQLTNMTFPNVTSLTLIISANKTCVLQYIFKEMPKLTGLHLNVLDTRAIRNSTFWDALLTGATAETAEKLKCGLNDPDSAEIIENINTPSIRRLINLTTLSLTNFGNGADFENGEPLLSEVPFIYAFFKMPKFLTLNLRGRFKISEEMRKSLKPKQPNFFQVF